MPAIDLERLRIRIKLIQDKFSQPSEFVSGLRELYSMYADRTLPLSSYHAELHALPAFNTPRLLNRALEDAFSGYCSEQPLQLLVIIDLLWQQPETELRQLAAVLLGRLPISIKEEVIARIIAWSSDQRDALLLPYVHEFGSVTIRRHQPSSWLEVLDKWKTSQEIWQIKLSIQGIIALIDDRDFANLPAIFSFLMPLFSDLNTDLQYDLRIVLEHLVDRSEVETVYFLKQLISKSKDPALYRFLRRSVELFTPEMQDSLRKALRAQEEVKKEHNR